MHQRFLLFAVKPRRGDRIWPPAEAGGFRPHKTS